MFISFWYILSRMLWPSCFSTWMILCIVNISFASYPNHSFQTIFLLCIWIKFDKSHVDFHYVLHEISHCEFASIGIIWELVVVSFRDYHWTQCALNLNLVLCTSDLPNQLCIITAGCIDISDFSIVVPEPQVKCALLHANKSYLPLKL